MRSGIAVPSAACVGLYVSLFLPIGYVTRSEIPDEFVVYSLSIASSYLNRCSRPFCQVTRASYFTFMYLWLRCIAVSSSAASLFGLRCGLSQRTLAAVLISQGSTLLPSFPNFHSLWLMYSSIRILLI